MSATTDAVAQCESSGGKPVDERKSSYSAFGLGLGFRVLGFGFRI